jgi:hypothetical protein
VLLPWLLLLLLLLGHCVFRSPTSGELNVHLRWRPVAETA